MSKRTFSTLDTEDKKKKNSKVSHDSDLHSEENKTKCWIFLLPSEILQQIFNLLPPRSLNAVSKLNCKLFEDSLRRIKTIDLSLCNDISHNELQQLFVTDRTPFIRKINFNHLFLVTVSKIESVILKCKNLTSLSVVGCGLTIKNICRILCQCKQLKELYWNVNISNGYTNCDENSTLHVKKVYLYFEQLEFSEFSLFVRHHWFSASEMYLIMSHNLSSMVSCSCRSSFSFRLHVYKNGSFDQALKEWIGMFRCLKNRRFTDFDWILVLNSEEDLADNNTVEGAIFSFNMKEPFLQCHTEDFSFLSLIPENSIKKLVLHSFGKMLLPQQEDILQKVIGKDLKYLSIQENSCVSEHFLKLNLLRGGNYINQELQAVPFCGSLSGFTSNACNIQDLIISDLHFNGSFDFEPLYCLRAIKNLTLPSCVFYSESTNFSNTTSVHLKQKKDESFQELVEKCKEVQHFSMFGCHLCEHGPKDKDISAIPNWKKLHSLTLEKIRTLCFCYFLKDLPEKCPDFKNLELINIGYPLVRHYLPNVMHVLTKSSKLAVLRTVLDSLCFRNQKLWGAISDAKELQILCLTITSPLHITCKPICDAVSKLPYLHTFHLCSPTRNNTLAANIRRIMKRNGVKQPKVEVTLVQMYHHNYGSCVKSHFYVP